MGFFQNMLDEAGTKTGKAIGNKLFGSNADDIRIGTSGKNEIKAAKEEAKGKIELAKQESENRIKELEAQQRFEKEANIQSTINEIQSFQLSTKDVDINANFLIQLLSLIESIDSNDDDKEELLKTATSKFKMGIDLCKSIDPSNPSIKMLAAKYDEKINNEKEAQKKSMKTLIIWFIVSLVVMVILLVCQQNGIL